MSPIEVPTEEVDLVLDARAELGEGPLWDERRGVLWWVDIMAGRVHRFDPAAGDDRAYEVGQPVGAVALRASRDDLVLAVQDGFALLDPESGEVRQLREVEKGQPGNRMNDAYCDPRGRLWAGTMAMDETRAAGALYRLDRDLRVVKVLEHVGTSNGIDWSSDGRTMYYVDSPTRRVDAFDYDPETGSIGNRRAVVTFPSELGVPDGMVLDAEDYLWVAAWGGWQLRRYDPQGDLDRVVHLPVARVTKCAFGGPGLDDLYITTAWRGSSEQERAEQPHAGGVFRCRPGIRGRAPHRFAG